MPCDCSPSLAASARRSIHRGHPATALCPAQSTRRPLWASRDSPLSYPLDAALAVGISRQPYAPSVRRVARCGHPATALCPIRSLRRPLWHPAMDSSPCCALRGRAIAATFSTWEGFPFQTPWISTLFRLGKGARKLAASRMQTECILLKLNRENADGDEYADSVETKGSFPSRKSCKRILHSSKNRARPPPGRCRPSQPQKPRMCASGVGQPFAAQKARMCASGEGPSFAAREARACAPPGRGRPSRLKITAGVGALQHRALGAAGGHRGMAYPRQRIARDRRAQAALQLRLLLGSVRAPRAVDAA